MGALWFVLVTLVLTVYILLDGFDLGVGIVYLLVSKNDDERRIALNAIGPIWSGNEVWLVMGGGILFLAFPKVYAAGLSGFYLGVFLLLWLLIGRGLSLELRSQFDSPVWRTFWDTAFSVASLALVIVLGVVWGNLLRGVPLNADGYFFTPFWTNWLPGGDAGLLDWYTILTAVTAVVILGIYGATYLALRTNGQVRDRATRLTLLGRWPAALLAAGTVAASVLIQPALRASYGPRLYGLILVFVALLGLLGIFYYGRRAEYADRNLGAAFVSTGLLILGLLSSTAFGLYPNLLVATTDGSYSLTIYNAAAAPESLRVAVAWFVGGIALVIAYSIYSYRTFRGKVTPSSIEEGY
jgi:cytochrome d ubiquinol oxidase subunit II